MPDNNDSRVLNVVIDQRFKRCPEGKIWTFTPPSYDFFGTALRVFEKVRVIARTTDAPAPPERARLVCGPGVELVPIPSYVGPAEYLARRSAIKQALRACASLDGRFLFRIPSQIAFLVAEMIETGHRPYGAELLTDPPAFFSPGVAPHGLAFLFRPYFTRRTRELCARAVAVNYVTGSSTQRAYPAAPGAWSSRVSDVDLPEEAFLDLAARHSRPRRASDPIRVVCVGYLDLLAKGQDVLIKSIAAAKVQGHDFHLTFVGDGRQRANLMRLADSLGVAQQVSITGALGGPAQVREKLQDSDLFSLPSRAEGIPRALLEAMAAGLPAICSRVGGMADFLEPRWLVDPGSVPQLTAALVDFAQNRHEWASIGARNQNFARPFLNRLLESKRLDFYRAIQTARSAAPGLASLPADLNHAA
jgi:glycosyltransferase involved in cell wall biosynthesis